MRHTKYTISEIKAYPILDSRGNPTVEVKLSSGSISITASVPSGASTGVHEAKELRDENVKYFHGMGVDKACENIKKIIWPKLRGKEFNSHHDIDKILMRIDKNVVGANAVLAVSLGSMKLYAKVLDVPLYVAIARAYGFSDKFKMPVPLFNVINGGKHADSGLDVQEFFLIPQQGSFATRLRQSVEVYVVLKQVLSGNGYEVGLGDEGGFAPKLKNNEHALMVLTKAIVSSGYKAGYHFKVGADVAASEFFDKNSQTYRFSADKKSFKPVSVWKVYDRWIKKYKMQIIEDPCAEDDFMGWKVVTENLGGRVMLVGDDLFVTQAQRLQEGIINGIANSVLIKPNQVGTLTETVATIKLSESEGYKVIASHRSGETNDSFIADLAVGVGADFIKAGAPARGERVAKYNRLAEIEREINGK